MTLKQLATKLKGGPGSGHRGHSGRPGKRGGSSGGKGGGAVYGNHSESSVQEGLDFVEGAILSSRLTKNASELSDGTKTFLRETVDPSKNYVLYRGIGVIKDRVDKSDVATLNALRVGDTAPKFLGRQTSDIASYTKKKGLAKSYAEGKVDLVLKTTARNRVIADLENLPKVLTKLKIPHNFDRDDLNYMKTDKEVFVHEPAKSVIDSKSGRI